VVDVTTATLELAE